MSARLPGIKRLYLDDRSGSLGVIWEPLILASFVIAAGLTGASSPISTLFSDVDDEADQVDESAALPSVGSGMALATPPPTAAPPVVSAPASVPTRTREEVVRPEGRALIQWWDDERWESRDAEAADWRRDWLRIARTSPARVPLELWVSILEWAPEDRSLVRSAERAADAYSSRRRRSGWRAGDGADVRTRADVIDEIRDAVRAAARRSDYEAHKDDGPDSSWYRSLLRRIRGGEGGADSDRR